MYKPDNAIFSHSPGAVDSILAAHSSPVCTANKNKANESGNNHKTQAYLPILHGSLLKVSLPLHPCFFLAFFKDHYSFPTNVLEASILSSECFGVLTEIPSEGLGTILLLLYYAQN